MGQAVSVTSRNFAVIIIEVHSTYLLIMPCDRYWEDKIWPMFSRIIKKDVYPLFTLKYQEISHSGLCVDDINTMNAAIRISKQCSQPWPMGRSPRELFKDPDVPSPTSTNQIRISAHGIQALEYNFKDSRWFRCTARIENHYVRISVLDTKSPKQYLAHGRPPVRYLFLVFCPPFFLPKLPAEYLAKNRGTVTGHSFPRFFLLESI